MKLNSAASLFIFLNVAMMGPLSSINAYQSTTKGRNNNLRKAASYDDHLIEQQQQQQQKHRITSGQAQSKGPKKNSKPPNTNTVPTQTPSSMPSQYPSLSPSSAPSAFPSEQPTIFEWMDIISYGGTPSDDLLPLGQCYGDCDSDSDCAVGLYCFQRSPYEAIPGCLGGDMDATNTDFCTIMYNEPYNHPDPTIDQFRLKLYWEEGYYWQEEDFEREWCMRCLTNCTVGASLEIADCSRDSIEYFDFVQVLSDIEDDYHNFTFWIQVYDTDLCFERFENEIFLQDCNATNPLQQWIGKDDSELDTNDKFAITQVGYETYCVTQHHHPKHGEIVEMYTCEDAEEDTTLYWEKY